MLQRIQKNIIQLIKRIESCKLDIKISLNRYEDKEYTESLLYYLILVKCEEVRDYLEEIELNLYAMKGLL
jgi:hypothetical protein